MSNHKFAAEAVAISIGEQRNGAGDPLVVVGGAGVLGTLAELRGLIDRFEAQDQIAGQSSREAVDGFDDNRSCA